MKWPWARVVEPEPVKSVVAANADIYLDLMELVLVNAIYPETEGPAEDVLRYREDGTDTPKYAHTMIGLRRLRNLRACCEKVLEDGIPGDFIEAGVWRGGAAIMMQAVLYAQGDRARTVYLADSFQGLPAPDTSRYPADTGSTLHELEWLRVSVAQVQENFRRYGLLDDSVRFTQGWFRETLPMLTNTWAVIRLDGDMYESTMNSLSHLYPRLSVGGFVIVDDYGCMEPCRRAVDDYRAQQGVTEYIETIDWTGIMWRRLR